LPSVRARIQHHPSRANLLPVLLDRLAPIPTEVVEHSSLPPSPWLGYRKCMADPPDCSHLLIVQDDAIPAVNFPVACEQIAAAKPEHPVCLFLARLPRDASAKAARAMKMNVRYVELSWRCFLPVVAVLWPLEKLVEFAEWADENPGLPGQREPRSDDAMGGRWKMVTRQTVYACVPSIVQHPDETPSTIGIRAQWGRDRGRTAEFFADDALDYDWSS
jgi:hypothetical protein